MLQKNIHLKKQTFLSKRWLNAPIAFPSNFWPFQISFLIKSVIFFTVAKKTEAKKEDSSSSDSDSDNDKPAAKKAAEILAKKKEESSSSEDDSDDEKEAKKEVTKLVAKAKEESSDDSGVYHNGTTQAWLPKMDFPVF